MHTYLLRLTRRGTNSGWIHAVNSVAMPLSHSTPMFTYLLAATAVMTGPLTLRQPPRLYDVPSSSSVKILRAPGLVWWFWRELACTWVVGCIQEANCSNAFTLLPYECVCASQSEVSLNNLVAGFVPLAIHPSIHSSLCLASGNVEAIPLPLWEWLNVQRQVTESEAVVACKDKARKTDINVRRQELKALKVIYVRLEDKRQTFFFQISSVFSCNFYSSGSWHISSRSFCH